MPEANEAIKADARKYGNEAELSLLPLLENVSQAIAREKAAITGGLDKNVPLDTVLLSAAREYHSTREATTGLQRIAESGFEEISKYKLAEILNYPYTNSSIDQSAAPVFTFLRAHEAELLQAVHDTALGSDSDTFSGKLNAVKWLQNNIRDYDSRARAAGIATPDRD